jgi:hypothetical protein
MDMDGVGGGAVTAQDPAVRTGDVPQRGHVPDGIQTTKYRREAA